MARCRVPGASLAVLHDGAVFETASGVLSQATGVEVTTDTVFQIGSITKVFTTTLMMQLVDEGRVELDAPVRDCLPEFRLADPVASASITIRHLLTHTSGMDGDYFLDTAVATTASRDARRRCSPADCPHVSLRCVQR